MAILFWILFLFMAYTYAGYPLALLFLSRWSKKPVHKGHFEPRISIILSAFNEEKAIEAKLLNLLDIDYPEDKIEILVGSDGASDRTDEIISRVRSPRVRFFRFVANLGKPHVLNALVEETRGEILVFTDARQEFDRKSVRMLMRNFHDPAVGCVSGELFFKAGEAGAGRVEKGMDAYWRYEKFLRKKESEIGSMLGATGAIYAARKELFPKLPEDILADDLYAPLEMVSRGYRAVFDPEAHAYDRPSRKSAEEFKRKVRTLAGNYQILFHLPNLLNPGRSPVAWQLISHKLLRLAAPFVLIGLLSVNLFLMEAIFYRIVFLAQMSFYGLAAIEGLSEKRSSGKKGLGYIPYMFCLLNYCALMGFIRFVSGKHKAAWEKAYA